MVLDRLFPSGRRAVGTKEVCGAVKQRKVDLKMLTQVIVAEGNAAVA
jgi:hypothetical protein